MIKKYLDILYMAKDLPRIITGRDYFHQRQGLGKYFQDGCSYYNDLRGKVNWSGKYINGVPVLFLPAKNNYIFFPTMILHYGLGSIDTYFETHDSQYLNNITYVYEWVINNINSEYYFDNFAQLLDDDHEYYSNNSAMTQSEALSFLIRVSKYNLVKKKSDKIEELIKNIFSNMILPVEKNGTVIKKRDKLYLCEFCRKDNYVILNGWIFAIFGLYDFNKYFKDEISEKYLATTLKTLESDIPIYLLKNGWSYYDNKRRLCSPFYQDLHINLIDALYVLTNQEILKHVYHELREGYTLINKCKYTFTKVVEKLQENYRYTTQK